MSVMDDAVVDALDHRAKVQACAGPMLVLHAHGDHLVPPDHATDLAGWAGERAKLVMFDRGDHNTIHYYNGDEILTEVCRFTGVTGR